MELTAVLLRWYRSFNVATIGPADPVPTERWHTFRGQSFPFVSVPLDRSITTVVGANESGKSHLLSAIAKVIGGSGMPGPAPDNYEIKDICRYCGFSALDQDVWPEIGVELRAKPSEAVLFEAKGADTNGVNEPSVEQSRITIMLNGGVDNYATAFIADAVTRTFTRDEWYLFAGENLPHVAVLNSGLALPNEVHIDELLDLYEGKKPRRVVDPLAVQDLWREIEPIEVVAGGAVDQGTAQRVQALKSTIANTTKGAAKHERDLVRLLFSGVLGVTDSDLKRMRSYSNTERGYVSWVNDEINALIDRELDISRYWDQDEDFRLSVNYKAGTFHFQITDRTGSTYTFNERSSGLRYFLSYYIQAKALEKLEQSRGVVILMDEPDSYLSASGQRSLLRVFDTLVSKKTARGTCQLIYTTHSPFLINRNFPDRIRLVRKGDGSEGTQYVPRAAVRRFEPVRSALSIDAADTLFLGSTNVVLEGHSDQKLLTACVQRFGIAGRLEDVLDLNTVTLVAAGGAPHAPELVKKALKGDDKPPVVVVLLDGDEPGSRFAQQVATIIDKRQVCTLREVDLGTTVAEVLEDIVPVSILDKAVQAYLRRLGLTCDVDFRAWSQGSNHAERISSFCESNVQELSGYGRAEIRSGVVDALIELLADESFHMTELSELQQNAERVFQRINEMVDYAERHARQHSLKKLVRQRVETFVKRFPLGASKGDAKRLLEDLKHIAFGPAEDAERTRKNADSLLQQLDLEARHNSDPIQIQNWHSRLQRLKNEPWAKVPDWAKLVPAAVAPTQPPRAATADDAGGSEAAH